MAVIRSVEDAAAYLEGLINFERRGDYASARLDLAPIRGLLARLEHPERGLSILHVAGSKGKGSTCLLAERVLAAAGERVGTFTSPHLERWSERFRIGGREVDGAALAAAVERVRPHVDAMRAEELGRAPTFFDATTAVALLLFSQAELDRVLLEVGLGGRLDSTNAVTPALSCVTSIELEHTEKLGSTLAAIAGEKAGILKPGVPCVVGRLPEEALEVVLARARSLDAPVARAGVDFDVEVEGRGADGLALRYREADGLVLDATLPLLGRHHAASAALALACARRLGLSGRDLAAAARRGLAEARLPGRAELLAREPWIVVDAAHTVASAHALAAALEVLPARRRHLVLSVSAGKQLPALLRILLPGAAEVTATRADPHRSLSPAAVADAARACGSRAVVRIVPNPHLAVRAARAKLGPGDLLCVTGSVYLAGIARAVLRAGGDSARVLVSRRSPSRSEGSAPGR